MKKIGLLALILLIVISGCTKPTYSAQPNAEFTTYLDELFLETSGDNLMDLYFALSDYSQFGITKPEATLGSAGTDEKAINLINERLSKLQSYDYSTLDLQQQRIYSHFETKYKTSLDSVNFNEFSWNFRPNSGLTSNLLLSFMEYKFKDEQRITDYLVLLQDMDRLLIEASERSKEQAKNGIYMDDKTIDATIDAINKFVESVENNQLIMRFDERIETVDFLTNDQKQSYKDQNKAIVIDEVIPSFSAVKEVLVGLKGSSKYEGGLVNYPNGKAYYETIVASRVGTTKSPDQLYKEGQAYLENLTKQLQEAASTHAESFEERSKYIAEGSNPADVINGLMEKSDAYFLRGPQATFTASFLDESITSANVSAYYLIPEYDTPEDNVIRINPTYNKDNPLGMYLTLAHEGYPGHMYQTTYFYNTVNHPIAAAISRPGYSEGWAMYASLYAYEMLGFEEAYTAELFKFDQRFNYTINSMIDIGVNYYGWDLDMMVSEVNKLGLDLTADPKTAENTYYAVVHEPGQILSYGIGLKYFDDYLTKVKNALGDKLDLIDYHQMLLETGPVSFELLDSAVEMYINDNK